LIPARGVLITSGVGVESLHSARGVLITSGVGEESIISVHGVRITSGIASESISSDRGVIITSGVGGKGILSYSSVVTTRDVRIQRTRTYRRICSHGTHAPAYTNAVNRCVTISNFKFERRRNRPDADVAG